MKNSTFQFKDLRLLGIEYKLNPEYSAGEESEEIQLEIASETIVRKSGTDAKVILILNVFKERDIQQVPFSIQITMEGYFTWGQDLDEETCDRLLRTNAPAVLLSYIRPYVSQLTSGSGYPPLILPLMDFRSNKVTIE